MDISQQRLKPEPPECLARECEPLELALVEGEAESRLWREHVERYPYRPLRRPSELAAQRKAEREIAGFRG